MTQSKEDKHNRLSEAVLRLLANYGEDGLKIARVARSANVSRPWIYKYVGTKKDDLVELATDRFAKLLSPSVADQRKIPETPEQWVQDRLDSTRYFLKFMLQYPYVINLYYRYRGSQTQYGDLIERYEIEYDALFCKQAQKALKITTAKAKFFSQTFTAIRFGLAHQLKTSEKHSAKDIERLVKLTEAILERIVREK